MTARGPTVAPELRDAMAHGTREYDDLPEAIKQYYSPQEYVAIGDARRAGLVREECEPETFEDGV